MKHTVIKGFTKQEEKDIPVVPEVSDILKAARRLYEPAYDITDSDLQLNNEQLKEVLEGILGEDTIYLQTMVLELEQEGFKQQAAGNVLYWLLKRKI